MSHHRPTPSFGRQLSRNATPEPRGRNAHRCVRRPMPVIDIGCALDLLAAAVQRRGDSHVDTPVWTTEANCAPCLCAHNGSPDCIVGEALARAGARVEELKGLCDHGIRELHRDGKLPVTLTFGALVVLHTAQQSQDRGCRWVDALEHATTAAVKFLELVPAAVLAASIHGSGTPELGVTPEVVDDKQSGRGRRHE
jgi:hypothetical protein